MIHLNRHNGKRGTTSQSCSINITSKYLLLSLFLVVKQAVLRASCVHKADLLPRSPNIAHSMLQPALMALGAAGIHPGCLWRAAQLLPVSSDGRLEPWRVQTALAADIAVPKDWY